MNHRSLGDLGALPSDARVWVFGLERELLVKESEVLLDEVDRFLETWAAHGVPLRAARGWQDRRFLIVGADVSATAPSGCSIDALVHILQRMERRLSVRILGHGAIHYRDDDGSIQRVSRQEFQELARKGCVTPATIVFDTTITTCAQWRDGSWQAPAGTRWHRVFFK